MTKQCELTGVKISLGNNVSHAHNKTKRIYLESASYSASSIRLTSRSLGIRTDSSIRFEKGLSREEGYEIIQSLSTKAWLSDKNFEELLLKNKKIKKYISAQELEKILLFKDKIKSIIFKKNLNITLVKRVSLI